jgi:hypothetical protein
MIAPTQLPTATPKVSFLLKMCTSFETGLNACVVQSSLTNLSQLHRGLTAPKLHDTRNFRTLGHMVRYAHYFLFGVLCSNASNQLLFWRLLMLQASLPLPDEHAERLHRVQSAETAKPGNIQSRLYVFSTQSVQFSTRFQLQCAGHQHATAGSSAAAIAALRFVCSTQHAVRCVCNHYCANSIAAAAAQRHKQ